MLRQFAAVAIACIAALSIAAALSACGVKGPLRLPSPAAPIAPAPPANPQSRPPLLPSEPPTAIVPPEPAKKP